MRLAPAPTSQSRLLRARQYLVHRVTFLARPAAFHREEAGPEPEHPVAAPVFLAVAEPELPVARPRPAAHLAEAAVAARASAVVEQTQSARSC